MSRHKVLSKTKQLHDLQHRFPFFLSLSLHPLARSLVTTWSGKAVWRKHMLLNWTWFAHFPAAQAHFTCCPCCRHATHQHETRRLVQPLCMSHIKKSLLFSKFRCAKNKSLQWPWRKHPSWWLIAFGGYFPLATWRLAGDSRMIQVAWNLANKFATFSPLHQAPWTVE